MRWGLMFLYCVVALGQLAQAGKTVEGGVDQIAADLVSFFRKLSGGIPMRTVWGERMVKGTLLAGVFDIPALSLSAGLLDMSSAIKCCHLYDFLKRMLQNPIQCDQCNCVTAGDFEARVRRCKKMVEEE